MNCILKDATRTDAKGNKTAVEHLLQGSQIAFFVFPNMLKKAPMFKRVRDWKRNSLETAAGPGGQARGQAAAIIRKRSSGSSSRCKCSGGAPDDGLPVRLVFSLSSSLLPDLGRVLF